MFAAPRSSLTSSARLRDLYVIGVSMNFLGLMMLVLVLLESIESSRTSLFLITGDFFSSFLADMGSLTITMIMFYASDKDALVQLRTSRI